MSVLVALFALAQGTPPGGSLAFTPPAGWQSRASASTMRVAEFVVPKAAGDTEDAEVIVYYFGGTGGSVEANVDRWIGQMQQPDGSPSKDKATRRSQTVNGLAVSTVDVSGTYVAEVRPGATERHNKPNFRLRAAVVETPRGPYYIKMTGPAKTVAAADADYQRFVASVRFAPPAGRQRLSSANRPPTMTTAITMPTQKPALKIPPTTVQPASVTASSTTSNTRAR
jgi:hypothetical protein